MKKIKSFLIALMAVVCLLPALTKEASAASNPYPYSQTVGGVKTIPCTWYAWQQTYERLGIALPAWGNAIDWYNNAARAGYSVGATAKANSIAVWRESGHNYGHVAFVTAVNGSNMTVNEGGRTDLAGNNGIKNGQVVYSTVGSTWYSRTLVGFIYLNGTPSTSASWVEYADKWSVGSTNASLSARVNLNVDISAVSKVGVYLYDYAGKQLATCSESPGISGYTYMNMWFDVNSELHYTLKAGTPYKCKFFVVVSGKTYESPFKTFKTTGTHIHTPDAGVVTKNPSCSATGVKTVTCTTCGSTKTESIAKTDHTYKPATCVAPQTCSVCGAKSGAALGHTPAAAVIENKVDATSTSNGSYETVVYCQSCKKELSREKTVVSPTPKDTKATTATKPAATTKATVATKATTKATVATKATQPAATKVTAATKATVATKEPVQTPQIPVETEAATNATSAWDYLEPPVDSEQDTGNNISIKRVIIVAVVIAVIGKIIVAWKKK